MADLAVNLDRADTRQEHMLGAVHEDPLDGSKYRYVKYSTQSSVDGAVGGAVIGVGTNQWKVTRDIGTGGINEAKGFLQAALTDSQFGWAQTRGYNRQSMATPSSAVADAEKLTFHTTSNGAVITMADGLEEAVVATAHRADSGAVMPIGGAFIEIE